MMTKDEEAKIGQGYLKVRCSGAPIKVSDLKEFQGDFKVMTLREETLLRQELMTSGICEPLTVWMQGDKPYVLNGHQRLRTIKKLLDENAIQLEGDTLPVSVVEAEGVTEAKRIMLALASTYGIVNEKGYKKVLKQAKLTEEEGQQLFNFPGFALSADEKTKKKGKGKKIEFETKLLRCPQCGKEGEKSEFKISKEEAEELQDTEE